VVKISKYLGKHGMLPLGGHFIWERSIAYKEVYTIFVELGETSYIHKREWAIGWGVNGVLGKVKNGVLGMGEQ
jgi:hypothetical protein